MFPRWEYRAWWISTTYQPIRDAYCSIRNAYCSIRDAYCGIRNRLKNPMTPLFMSLVCRFYVVFMSFLCHLLILQSSEIELNTTNLCHMSLVFVISHICFVFPHEKSGQGRRSILLTWLFDSQDLVSCVLVPTAIFPLACNANFLVPCFEHHQCHFP